MSYPTFAELRDSNEVFSGVYAFRLEQQAVSLGGANGADRIYAEFVSASYFDVIGVIPATDSRRCRESSRSERPG